MKHLKRFCLLIFHFHISNKTAQLILFHFFFSLSFKYNKICSLREGGDGQGEMKFSMLSYPGEKKVSQEN